MPFIAENESVILVIPIIHIGAIKYPTNRTTIGANPITFPILDFLAISLSFPSFPRLRPILLEHDKGDTMYPSHVV